MSRTSRNKQKATSPEASEIGQNESEQRESESNANSISDRVNATFIRKVFACIPHQYSTKEVWSKIEQKWDYHLPGSEAVKNVIRSILVHWQEIERDRSTSGMLPASCVEHLLEIVGSSTIPLPSPKVLHFLGSSLKNSAEMIFSETTNSGQSQSTGTTSTSSTPALSATTAAVVDFGDASRSPTALLRILKEEGGVSSSQEQTGAMLCTISGAEKEKLYTSEWKSPIMDEVLELSHYKRRDLLGVRRDHWWEKKTMKCTMTFPTASPAHLKYLELTTELSKLVPPAHKRASRSRVRYYK